jgi:hypothetical protein
MLIFVLQNNVATHMGAKKHRTLSNAESDDLMRKQQIIEHSLFQWLQNTKCVFVMTNELLLVKAEKLGAQLHVSGFSYSLKWLEDFKKRHGIMEYNTVSRGVRRTPILMKNILPDYDRRKTKPAPEKLTQPYFVNRNFSGTITNKTSNELKMFHHLSKKNLKVAKCSPVVSGAHAGCRVSTDHAIPRGNSDNVKKSSKKTPRVDRVKRSLAQQYKMDGEGQTLKHDDNVCEENSNNHSYYKTRIKIEQEPHWYNNTSMLGVNLNTSSILLENENISRLHPDKEITLSSHASTFSRDEIKYSTHSTYGNLSQTLKTERLDANDQLYQDTSHVLKCEAVPAVASTSRATSWNTPVSDGTHICDYMCVPQTVSLAKQRADDTEVDRDQVVIIKREKITDDEQHDIYQSAHTLPEGKA